MSSRRRFLKTAAYLGAGALIAAGLGLPLATARPDRFRHRHPMTSSTKQTSSSTKTSSSSSSSTTIDASPTGMMAILDGFSGGTETGEAQWAALDAALAQPGVQNVPVIGVVLPGLQQDYAENQLPYMLSLLQKYPGQIRFIAYDDTCGEVEESDGCTYDSLATAEQIVSTSQQWYNTVQSYNPKGVETIVGNWFDDADWTGTNVGGLTPEDYYGQLQDYAVSLGLSFNLGNSGGLPTAVGTLLLWNVWETPDYPTVSYLQQAAAMGVPAKNLCWICNGASTFDAAMVQSLAPYCGWCWVVPSAAEGNYYLATYASQLMTALAQMM